METSPRVFDAVEFAARAHRGQVRKGSGVPYLVHPLGVMRLLIEHGAPEDVVVAGVLHDTLEDTPVTRDDLARSFGEEVATLVEALSEPDKDAAWEVRKQHTVDHLGQAPREVLLASCADKLDNLRAIEQDLERMGEAMWQRFKRGRPQQAWYYRSLAGAFGRRWGEHPLIREFLALVEQVFPAE